MKDIRMDYLMVCPVCALIHRIPTIKDDKELDIFPLVKVKEDSDLTPYPDYCRECGKNNEDVALSSITDE